MSANPRPLPPPLARGARVGVMALSGPPDPAALAAGLDWLRAAGFEVVPAPNLAVRSGYLAGSDRERIDGLERLLDVGVDALLAARGGYGATRLLPELPWERLAAWGGWVVGFSDLTALHAGLATRFPVATLHGPVGTTLASDAEGGDRLLAWLRGEAPASLFALAPEQVVRGGRARGVSAGGNLSMLVALLGTPYEPVFDGAVVFLEDVGEPLYRLDRLLTQLRLSSRLARAQAVVAGRFARCGRDEPAARERLQAMLAESVPGGAVLVEGLPFGHDGTNRPFPLGVEVEVDTAQGQITWDGA